MSFFEIFLLAIIFFVLSTFLVMSLGVLLKTNWGAPFVPSRQSTVYRMIHIARIRPGDVVFDLGCGDGRIVFAADKAGAKKSIGIEISLLVFFLAHTRKIFSGAKSSEIRFGNFFRSQDISSADIIFAFLFPEIMDRIFRDIWPHLKPGTRIISHAFSPHNILPDHIFPKTDQHGKIYVFIKK